MEMIFLPNSFLASCMDLVSSGPRGKHFWNLKCRWTNKAPLGTTFPRTLFLKVWGVPRAQRG